MLSKFSRTKLLDLSKYDRIAVLLFRKLSRGYTATTLPDDLHFDLDDVRAVMKKAVDDDFIDEVVRNVADIKYTYDARRDLPEECEQCGPRTWLQNGKGVYILRA